MAADIATEITVKRKLQDGWSVYTCDMLPGLYVADKDDQVAYEDLPTAISTLIKLNFGVDVCVLHKLEYPEFLERIRLYDRAKSAVRDRTEEMMESGLPTYFSFTVTPRDGSHSRQ